MIYEAGPLVSDRLDTSVAAVRAATYTLATGETFSEYDELACWIDNNTALEAKFMYLLVDHFMTSLGTTGNWVDWSDNRFCGVSFRTDTTFQVLGNGMGIRKDLWSCSRRRRNKRWNDRRHRTGRRSRRPVDGRQCHYSRGRSTNDGGHGSRRCRNGLYICWSGPDDGDRPLQTAATAAQSNR